MTDGDVRAKTLRMDETWSLRAEDGWGCASQDFKDGRKTSLRAEDGWGCASQDSKDGRKMEP